MPGEKQGEAFEKWCLKNGWDKAWLAVDSDGDYQVEETQHSWRMWQAALSDVEASGASEVERLKKALKSAIGMTGLRVVTLRPSGEKVIEWNSGMRQSSNHPELFDELALTGKGEVG